MGARSPISTLSYLPAQISSVNFLLFFISVPPE
jgi:hypothetical protein